MLPMKNFDPENALPKIFHRNKPSDSPEIAKIISEIEKRVVNEDGFTVVTGKH